MAKVSSPTPGRLDQAERFFDTARMLGGGASAERFAELVSAIAAVRPAKAAPRPKPKRKAPTLIKLKSGR